MNNSENSAGCQSAAAGWSGTGWQSIPKAHNCIGKVWFEHLDRAVLMGDNSTMLAGNLALR